MSWTSVEAMVGHQCQRHLTGFQGDVLPMHDHPHPHILTVVTGPICARLVTPEGVEIEAILPSGSTLDVPAKVGHEFTAMCPMAQIICGFMHRDKDGRPSDVPIDMGAYQ